MSWREDAVVHARRVAPAEACGLVVLIDGVETFVAIKNTHPMPLTRFAIAPDAWAAAEDMGDIVAVFHSHATGSANPSIADRVACDRSGLPWEIYGVAVDVWKRIEPSTTPMPLLGREWCYGVVDCYTLVRDAMRQLGGVQLPDFERGLATMSDEVHLYEQHFQDAGFVEIAANGELRPLDLIVMQISATRPNHGAIYLGDGLMIHHPAGRLSMRDQYGGPWLRCTRLRLRHRELLDVTLPTQRVV